MTTLATETQKKIYSISQLNRGVKHLLESEYANIWVEGEISNFKHHSSGHMYLSLKDDKSQISAVFFSRSNQSVKFEIEDGLKVLVYGKLSLYEARGQYQFYIEKMEPKGVGALQLAFLQLKEKLEKAGLFSPEHKQEIPRFPKTVGVITSPTGAAIRDILNVMGRRSRGTSILIYPARVQGEGSGQEVAEAIEEMNRLNEVDVLIVGRGGGSLEDLWAFNEEVVARAIFKSKIPIISAVGHEIDWTIADFVADLRAPTPSAAAELVVENTEEIVMKLQDIKSRLGYALRQLIENYRERLNTLSESYAFKQPLSLIQQFAQRLDELNRQLNNYMKSALQMQQHRFQGIVGKLQALSPLNILERGYSLSFDTKGQLLKDVKSIKKGDALTTRLAKGVIQSEVISVDRKEVKP